MPTPENERLETRRIILLRLSRRINLEVLLGLDGNFLTLPEVHTSRWQRVAEQLGPACKQTCGIEPISLSPLVMRLAMSPSEQIAYEIMEPRRPEDESPLQLQWLNVNTLVQSEFQDGNDFEAIKRAIAQSMAFEESQQSGPFARLGWFQELERWVEEQIGPLGLHLTGTFRQFNAYPTFSLIRFETDGPAVWFKATGAPNLHEFRLTLALSQLFPHFLPPLIGTRPEWNGWLAFAVEGTHLDEASESTTWFSAARDLAELQVASSTRGLLLLESGARDLRLDVLRSRVEPFFQFMGDLMERQIKTQPRALSLMELRDLAMQVLEAIAVLGETAFPPALGHLDINPGNVICSAGRCVFLDWAEGFVGHPFLTFEYLVEYLRKSGANKTQEARILACYSDPWRRSLSDAVISRALEMAPLAAVFAYAARNELWNQPRTIEEPRREASLRSLTRRMHREAQQLRERGFKCRR